MCGITGYINEESVEQKKDTLQKMMDRIVHRGPSSAGMYVDEYAALGFRRLSIIDLEGGDQPIYNETNDLIITFNGEIYNYRALRQMLTEKGHIFKTNSDTETILHGYEEFGKEVLHYLRGMFAFVIWDKKKKLLFGARDHFGIKPLYYAYMNHTFLYASEIKSLLENPAFEKLLNKDALRPYLTYQYSALDETFFKGVFKLPEGHYFCYENNALKITKYFKKEKYIPSNEPLSNLIDRIDNTVIKSIEEHKIADVEVGSFLSSGVDSSYVTAVLRPKKTYSIGFDDKIYNESKEARRFADLVNLNNTSEILSAEEAFKYLPLIQYHMDEPDSNPSCVPLYFLAKLASKDLRVVLSGEGADELFAGYQPYGFYTNSKLIRKITEFLKKSPRPVQQFISEFSRKHRFPGSLHLHTNLSDPRKFFIGDAKVFDENEALDILQPEYRCGPEPLSILQNLYDDVQDLPNIKQMQYVDMHQWLPKQILAKADKLSMAHSLELRVPILDKEVFKVAEILPTKFLINEENTKIAFRKAAAKHLPEEWSNRGKLGFPVPIKGWLRTEKYYLLVRKVFEKEYVNEFFDQEKLLKMLDENYKGNNEKRREIWTIYTFLIWYDVFFIKNAKKPSAVE